MSDTPDPVDPDAEPKPIDPDAEPTEFGDDAGADDAYDAEDKQ